MEVMGSVCSLGAKKLVQVEFGREDLVRARWGWTFPEVTPTHFTDDGEKGNTIAFLGHTEVRESCSHACS